MNKVIVGLLLGMVIGGVVVMLLNQQNDSQSSKAKNKPLYWVAPMDPNFRRDKPGKSPMGMDLVPYYGDKNKEYDEVGVVNISPDVLHNFGVRTANVVQKALNKTIKASGFVTYDEDYIVHIHPRVEGWVEKLHVQAVGDEVRKGQALYDLYSPTLINAQGELLAALERGNQRLIKAAKAKLDALHFPPSAMKSLIQTKNINSYTTFFSPQDGYIDQLKIREGFYVDPHQTLMQIAQLDEVWVKAEIPEAQVADIDVGQNVQMKILALPDRLWKGTIDHIHPVMNLANRTLTVRMHFENKQRLLKPHMFAEVEIRVSDTKKTLLVPKEAVIPLVGRNRVVLALGEGRFKSIEIEVGQNDGEYYEVLSGLIIDDKVVTSAQFLLDSESSKTSDFKRSGAFDLNTDYPQAKTRGKIKMIDMHNRNLDIDREAIKKWDRPAALVNFKVAAGIDITKLLINDEIEFTFIIRQGQFIIKEINADSMTVVSD